jgi:hypothetical protein
MSFRLRHIGDIIAVSDEDGRKCRRGGGRRGELEPRGPDSGRYVK